MANVSNDETKTEIRQNEMKNTKTVKKYKNNDLIPCTSIVPGELAMIGKKTRILYKWFGIGHTIEVEYQDLMAAIISKSKHIFAPLFIIDDKNFTEQRKDITDLYNSMYTKKELGSILDLSPAKLRETLKGLPDGAKASVKILAAEYIQNGKLDSIKKISVLDEVLNTNLMTQSNLFI